MKGLLTSLQQTHPRPWPPGWLHASGCLLIFGTVCRTFRKAHGRYSSQKLMPRGGTLIPLRGAAVLFVHRPWISDKLQSAQTHSISTHSKTGPAYYLRPPSTATELWRSNLSWSETMAQSHPAADKGTFSIPQLEQARAALSRLSVTRVVECLPTSLSSSRSNYLSLFAFPRHC